MYAPYKTKGPLFSSTAGGPLLPTASAGKYTRSKRQTRLLLIRVLLAFGVIGIIGTAGYYSLKRTSSSGGFKAPQDSGIARENLGKNNDGSYEADALQRNKWKQQRQGEYAKRIAEEEQRRNNKENQGMEVASQDPVEQFRERRRQRQREGLNNAPGEKQQQQAQDSVQQEVASKSAEPVVNTKGNQVPGKVLNKDVPLPVPTDSFYDLAVPLVDATGTPFLLSSLKDKVTLVVNVASQCGYTASNYQGIQKVLDVYGSYGFEVLAFPCNDFGGQEPKEVQEISSFVKETYNSTVRIMGKVNDINHNSLFDWLRSHAPIVPGIDAGAEISWNFNKFLVDKRGNVVQRYNSEMIVGDLEHAVYDALVKDTPQDAQEAQHKEAVVTS